MPNEKIQALLKLLPNTELIAIRKKISQKIDGLKIRELVKTHNLVPMSLKKYEAGDTDNAKLNEFMRDLYIQELSKSEGILKYVSRTSLEMKQKVEELQKSEKPVVTQTPTAPKPQPAITPTTRVKPRSPAKPPKATKPISKRKNRKPDQEEKGLMILVAAGLPVSTTVSYDPGGMTIKVTGGRRILNNLVVSLKARS